MNGIGNLRHGIINGQTAVSSLWHVAYSAFRNSVELFRRLKNIENFPQSTKNSEFSFDSLLKSAKIFSLHDGIFLGVRDTKVAASCYYTII